MVESYKSNPTVYRVERATMGQDFTKGLNVCIGNYGYYNEGSLHDAWITLPKTEAEIRDFLHLNQLQDSQHEEIYISDYDGIPFGTRLLFNEFCHLEDLNLLAKQLVTANPADLEKVGAWIQANDTPESLVGLMNLIEQADDIPFYSWGYDGAYDKDEFGNMIYTTMSPERNYGYEMVEQNEELKHILDSSSQIESAFDYEKYGRAYTEGGEVTVLEDGYIDNCADGPDVDYYDRDELASLIATVMMRSIPRPHPKRRTAAWDINRKSAAMPPNCSMTGNRLWRLHPRSINRRKAYGAIPGKSLARINVRGTFSL